MLVLSRREGERVLVKSPSGELLGTILVRSAQRGRASIGFEFAAEVKIVRKEVEGRAA